MSGARRRGTQGGRRGAMLERRDRPEEKPTALSSYALSCAADDCVASYRIAQRRLRKLLDRSTALARRKGPAVSSFQGSCLGEVTNR